MYVVSWRTNRQFYFFFKDRFRKAQNDQIFCRRVGSVSYTGARRKMFLNAVPACVLPRNNFTERRPGAFRHKNTPVHRTFLLLHHTLSDSCHCYTGSPTPNSDSALVTLASSTSCHYILNACTSSHRLVTIM
jgi:hypothetical protein